MKIMRDSINEWVHQLAIVSTGNQQLIGLIGPDDKELCNTGRIFDLSNVLIYIANMHVQQTPQGMQLVIAPHLMVTYNLIEPLNSVKITGSNYVVYVTDQPEKFKECILELYINVFDPPIVKMASIIEMVR